jgi:hypothetical protein
MIDKRIRGIFLFSRRHSDMMNKQIYHVLEFLFFITHINTQNN